MPGFKEPAAARSSARYFGPFDLHCGSGAAWAETGIAKGAGRSSGDRSRREAFGELSPAALRNYERIVNVMTHISRKLDFSRKLLLGMAAIAAIRCRLWPGAHHAGPAQSATESAKTLRTPGRAHSTPARTCVRGQDLKGGGRRIQGGQLQHRPGRTSHSSKENRAGWHDCQDVAHSDRRNL